MPLETITIADSADVDKKITVDQHSTDNYVEVVKVGYGDDGSAPTLASPTNPLPTVDDAAATLLTAIQAATEAIQTIAETIISTESITSLNGSVVSAQEAQRVIIAKRTAANTAEDVDTDSPIPVAVVSGATSGTEYTEADVDSTPTGTAAMARNPSNELRSLLLTALGNLKVAIEEGTVSLSGNDYMGHVGGQSDNPFLTPTVTVGAYTAGDVIGGELTFTNALREPDGSGLTQNLLITTANAETFEGYLLVFDDAPAAAVADHAAFAWGTGDPLKLRTCIDITSANWRVIDGVGICEATNLGRALRGASTTQHLYGYLICTDTPTFAATDDLSIALSTMQD